MKPKKALLVFAIIFNIIAILFFVAFALIYFDNDTSGFTDNLTYSEGIVKEVNPNTNDNNKIIAYSIVLENNVIMTIDTDTIESEGIFSYVNKGDTVTFAFNGSAEKVANTNERIFVTPAFLSCDDKIIVSIESYEQSLLNNKNEESFIGLIAAIIFLIVSAMLYFLWFYKIKKWNNIDNFSPHLESGAEFL